MEKLSLDKRTLKKFGITIGIAFLAIALLLLARHKYSPIPLFISIIFFVFAFIIPSCLKPVYILWMRLAFLLGWMNTRLILFVLFYLVFTPIGLAMRLFGVDLLERKIEKAKESYWKKKEEKKFNPLDYERRF